MYVIFVYKQDKATFKNKMANPYASTEETTNANRTCRLILGPCTDQMRDVLRYHVAPSAFPSIVLQHKKKLLRLTTAQKDLILPRNGSYSGNYNDMDISLLYMLLRNTCSSSLPPHSNGWGNAPDPNDRSVSANIERIRLARNECVHSTSPTLSNTDFNCIWSTIKSSVVDLDNFLNNGNKYEGQVDKLRFETMDPVQDKYYRDELAMQATEDKTTRDMLNELKSK